MSTAAEIFPEPQTYTRIKLADLVEFRRGLTYKKKDEVDQSSNAVLRANNIDLGSGQLDLSGIRYIDEAINVPASKKLEAGSVLICTASGSRSHLGKAAYIDTAIDSAFGGFMGLLVPSSRLDGKFLHYFTRSDAYWQFLDGLAGGTNINNLKFKDLGELAIPLPELEEQKRIVAVLDQAFAALDRARAHTESNLVNAKEFLDQAREQLLSRDQTGWKEESLAYLITVKHGFAFKSQFFKNKGKYVLLTPGNFFERGGFRHRGEKQKYYLGEISEDFILNEGDLLMAMTEQAPGLLGSCILVPESNRFLHNQRLGLIQPKNPESWHSPYFAHVFNLRAFRKALSDTCTGIKVRHTSPDKIRSTKVPVPPNVDAQKSVAKQLDQIAATSENLAKAYSDKLDRIETLRKSLLHQAFSGYLT